MQDPGYGWIELHVGMPGGRFLGSIVWSGTFNEKVGQDLRIHGGPRVVGKVELIELDRPLHHAPESAWLL